MLTAGKIRLLLAVAIVAAIAGIVAVTVKRLSPPGQASPPVTVGRGDGADLQWRGIRLNEITDGRTTWTLVADRAEYDTAREEVRLAGVTLTVAPFDRSLGELTLVSPAAVYHTATRDVYLNGGVRASSSKGMEFTSQTLQFAGGRGLITTADPVRFSDTELAIEGTGMEYSVQTSALKIRRNVTATVRVGDRR